MRLHIISFFKIENFQSSRDNREIMSTVRKLLKGHIHIKAS